MEIPVARKIVKEIKDELSGRKRFNLYELSDGLQKEIENAWMDIIMKNNAPEPDPEKTTEECPCCGFYKTEDGSWAPTLL